MQSRVRRGWGLKVLVISPSISLRIMQFKAGLKALCLSKKLRKDEGKVYCTGIRGGNTTIHAEMYIICKVFFD